MIFRSIIKVGDLIVHNQRFVVVHNITSDVILGADFWSRVSPIQIDFEKKQLTLCSGLTVVGIHDGLPVMGTSHQEKEEWITCKVQVLSKCKLSPKTETLVKCKAKGLIPGDPYLLEPVRGEDDRFGVPYSVDDKYG